MIDAGYGLMGPTLSLSGHRGLSGARRLAMLTVGFLGLSGKPVSVEYKI
jgi:hypothetical protein